jgi:hypothetical protein
VGFVNLTSADLVIQVGLPKELLESHAFEKYTIRRSFTLKAKDLFETRQLHLDLLILCWLWEMLMEPATGLTK